MKNWHFEAQAGELPKQSLGQEYRVAYVSIHFERCSTIDLVLLDIPSTVDSFVRLLPSKLIRLFVILFLDSCFCWRLKKKFREGNAWQDRDFDMRLTNSQRWATASPPTFRDSCRLRICRRQTRWIWRHYQDKVSTPKIIICVCNKRWRRAEPDTTIERLIRV